MTFKEFKNAVEDWGRKYHYETVIDEDPYNIYMKFDFDDDIVCDIVFEIYKLDRFGIDFNWGLYRNLSDDEKRDLFKIVTEFTATPIGDREYEEIKHEYRKEFESAIDVIINRLEVIQANAEDVMNWTILEIQERSWNLRNTLEDIIIDLEKVREANERE